MQWLDGPVHGRRRQGDGGREAFWPEWRRKGSVEDMISDWQLAIDAVQAIEGAARRITCPVLFIQQLEDELFDREQCLALFDAIASNDKRLHGNPGLHAEVPQEELWFSIEFLERHLDPRQGETAPE